MSARDVTTERLLGSVQCGTFLGMSRLHADGWGTAWVDTPTGQVRRYREATAAFQSDQHVESALAEPSSARIVHLRMATAGLPVSSANTHPFLDDGIAFEHNGAIAPIGDLRSLLTPETIAGVRGQTDSELYFAYIRQNAAAAPDLLSAVVDAVNDLRLQFQSASLNALLLTSSELIVVHASETAKSPKAHFDKIGVNVGELPSDHIEGYYQMYSRRDPDGSLVVSSSGIDRGGWTPLPAATVWSVDLGTLELRERRLASIGG